MSEYFSIRMRSSQTNEHISGAERLVPVGELQAAASAMISRALTHSRGNPDSIHITIESIPAKTILYGRLPDITTVNVADHPSGRQAARTELLRAGVSEVAADSAIQALKNGAAPGMKVMRGAMLVDAATGERLEVDPARGVRVSRMDLTPDAVDTLSSALQKSGRDTVNLREALALAGKVLLSPGFVAELCWSDDPDYVAGYVASPARGYVRFPHLKERGDRLGGRAFFFHRPAFSLERLIAFLERRPVVFTAVGRLHDDEEFSG